MLSIVHKANMVFWAAIVTMLVFSSKTALSQTVPSESRQESATQRANNATPNVSTESFFAKDKTDRAVDKGIQFLVKAQKKEGSIHDKSHSTTMTSLSIMAMAGVGIQPSDPTREGKAMSRALSYVLQDDRVDNQGYFGRADGSRMYGHGITTLMLSEMLGMGTSDQQDKLIHDRCQKAIDVILSAQQESKPIQHRGGWRYEPKSRDADLSVSVWQLMALRSAKNDGLKVPSKSIEQAVAYLKRSYVNRSTRSGVNGNQPSGFSYEPGGNRASFTMTAAGLLAMQVCGQYESNEVRAASDWLLARKLNWQERFGSYGIYYYAQGMYQSGGKYHQAAQKNVSEILLKQQAADGSWIAGNNSEKNIGKVYATAMAILSLSVKYHYLPIYQK